MLRLIGLYCGVLPACLLIGSVGGGALAAAPALKTFASAQNSFGFALLKAADQGSSGESNTFVSPLSLAQAMAMLYEGSAGATRSQIGHALRFDLLGAAAVGSDSRALREDTTGADPAVKLSIANALWANTGVAFRPEFQRLCLNSFDAQATTLPFRDASSVDVINDWVSRNTMGKIPTIVTAQALRRAGALLTDAVYFHGKWSTPFDAKRTRPGVFHLERGTEQLPMMTRTGSWPTLQTPQFQAVRLPYGNGRLGMVIVLPRSGESIDHLEAALSAPSWSGWTQLMARQQVRIILPRFHADYSADLDAAFRAMGVTDVFDRHRADLGPMSPTPMYVSAIVHKTTLDVDEQGTVATAATGIVARPMMAVPPPPIPIVIRVDHPFVCAVQDSDTGALLFVGIIRDPQASAAE